MQPAFHRQRIAAYANIMAEHAQRTSEHWHVGDTVDMAVEMQRLTLGIVGKTLFDSDVDKDAEQVHQLLDSIL